MKEATESLWLFIKTHQKSEYQLLANSLAPVPTRNGCLCVCQHPPSNLILPKLCRKMGSDALNCPEEMLKGMPPAYPAPLQSLSPRNTIQAEAVPWAALSCADPRQGGKKGPSG